MTVACDDPYLWLEEVESEESLQFARDANEACLKALGDPTGSGTGTYDKVLSVLESSDRIPYASKYGKDDDGNDILMNFWKDSINPKGLWRRTTMESYRTEEPQWETVLDVDELAKTDGISWVWKVSQLLSFQEFLCKTLGTRSPLLILELCLLYRFLVLGTKTIVPRQRPHV